MLITRVVVLCESCFLQRRSTNKSLAGGRGGFSSGRKWADDAPKDEEEGASVAVMNMGACGAFVHGLEDEFMGLCHSSLCQLINIFSSLCDGIVQI